ncbi:MAG: YkgJ family cysteine cluster protein [Candidatus Omnitrophica bacterium]|nr:YkgJ family cysteine cluster protein [Candidatus Omnitrophota bacterium]
MQLPSLIPDGFCLDCRACCVFEGAVSPWRPKITAAEKQSLDPAMIAADGYISAAPAGEVYPCVCLNTCDHACQIYLQRPFECRLYPFVLVRRENKLMLAAHLACPYIQANRGTKSFAEYAEKLRQALRQEAAREILNANPQLAGDYPADQNALEDLFLLSGGNA